MMDTLKTVPSVVNGNKERRSRKKSKKEKAKTEKEKTKHIKQSTRGNCSCQKHKQTLSACWINECAEKKIRFHANEAYYSKSHTFVHSLSIFIRYLCSLSCAVTYASLCACVDRLNGLCSSFVRVGSKYFILSM